MMRPLSDFAAASAVPQFALITLIVPQQTKVAWVRGLYRGLRRAANRFEVSIVGGETSNTRGRIAISVSVIGFVEKPRAASRRGGRSGDDLFVTGRLGGALKRKHLKFVARIAESRWLTKNFSIHAMMDLSDGLGADLPRFARASKVGFDIQLENLPVARGATIDNAISEGEDYELLFAVSPRDRNRLERNGDENSGITADANWFAQCKSQSQIANYLLATFISNSPAETEAIARQIAEDLVAGAMLALKGELGSGKTLFTQGLVAGLESDAAVTSPTLHRARYQGGRLPVYHFDFFRLEIENQPCGLDWKIIFLAMAFQ
jgi:Thiamine monophosphate kinase